MNDTKLFKKLSSQNQENLKAIELLFQTDILTLHDYDILRTQILNTLNKVRKTKIEESEISNELELITDTHGDIFIYLIDGLRENINDIIINNGEPKKDQVNMFEYALDKYLSMLSLNMEEKQQIETAFKKIVLTN